MKEHPILYSTPMVQAILCGRKTMTRRMNGLDKINESPNSWQCVGTYHILSTDTFEAHFQHKTTKEIIEVKCNYGLPTDVLWVRETMIFNKNSETYWPVADGYVKTADYEKVVPSIHLPKIESRIWLKITSVKVERLQDISEVDAYKEGLKNDGLYIKCFCSKEVPHHGADLLCNDGIFMTNRQAFQSLWQAINGSESWEANPWVWAIEFEVLSTTGKPLFYSSRGNLLVNPIAPGSEATTSKPEKL